MKLFWQYIIHLKSHFGVKIQNWSVQLLSWWLVICEAVFSSEHTPRQCFSSPFNAIKDYSDICRFLAFCSWYHSPLRVDGERQWVAKYDHFQWNLRIMHNCIIASHLSVFIKMHFLLNQRPHLINPNKIYNFEHSPWCLVSSKMLGDFNLLSI